MIAQYDEATDLALDSGGNVYITGKCEVLGAYPYTTDYVTIKYNTNGPELWAMTYSSSGHVYDYPVDIAVDDADNVYVTGRSPHADSGFDYVTIKYNQNVSVDNEIWMNY